MALATPLREQLDRLAAFEPTGLPVLSLYLNLAPDNQGQARYEPFLRKVFSERARTLKGAARASFDRDVERITAHLDSLPASANGLVVFACSGNQGFFEVVQLDVPIDEHWLYVASVPHIYPLARIVDQNPRYAALLLDTNSARIFVFGLGATESRAAIHNEKTRRSSVGGWSQARYQRHNENLHLQHMKEVAEVLDRVVREEQIGQIVVACDDVARPMLMAQLPKHLAEKIIDMARLDITTPGHEVLSATLEALRGRDQETDAEHVRRMLDAWRANGLGVAGPEATMEALLRGEVEELIITATPERLRRARVPEEFAAPAPVEADTSQSGTVDTERLTQADDLVTRARQRSARIRFIEDAALLDEAGGVGALLRFRVASARRKENA